MSPSLSVAHASHSARCAPRVDCRFGSRLPRALLASSLSLFIGLVACPARADDVDNANDGATALDHVVVKERRQSLVGEAISASEGVVGAADIADRAMLRTGDLLEFVPGLIATAHSGSGKANQYFLRGFNLDHGTDFATLVDGMPVNMRSHAHGQGYTDLGFLIPETVAALNYRKGTYYADVGDFSSAGSASFELEDSFERGRIDLSVGGEGYRRLMLADSTRIGAGELLYAGEAQGYRGPWTQVDEDVRKRSGLLRYSEPLAGGQWHLTAMGYSNTWNSADQIPLRAVESGAISAYGSIDPTLGGTSSRYSLSGGWQGAVAGGEFDMRAYTIDYRLRLWSNATYFLDDPVNGDQIAQIDQRRVHGFTAAQQWDTGRSRWRAGVEGRIDDIDRVALLHSVARQPLDPVRDDRVLERSVGVHVANEWQIDPQWRSYVGVRHDAYRFRVDSDIAAHAGRRSAGTTSYKASLAWHAAEPLELYASVGTGFHSNDARGVVATRDADTGEAIEPASPLVDSRGAELGARLHLGQTLQASLAVWSLRLDSELLFVGDAGTTEASRPTRREGSELGVYWFPSQRYSANLEAAYTRTRFGDSDPSGFHVPGAIPLVLGAGVTAHGDSGWLASAQLRHFGRYPLIEDGSVRTEGSTMLNLRLGREWQRWGLTLDVLNLLDSADHDVEYYYASRLPGEPAEGVADRHFHIFPPRTLRATLRWSF